MSREVKKYLYGTWALIAGICIPTTFGWALKSYLFVNTTIPDGWLESQVQSFAFGLASMIFLGIAIGVGYWAISVLGEMILQVEEQHE